MVDFKLWKPASTSMCLPYDQNNGHAFLMVSVQFEYCSMGAGGRSVHTKKIWKFIVPPDVSVGVGSRKALPITWWPTTVQEDTDNLGVVPALWWPNWKAFGLAMGACSDPAGTLRPEGALQMSRPFQPGPVAGTRRRTRQEETLSARLTEGRATNAI